MKTFTKSANIILVGLLLCFSFSQNAFAGNGNFTWTGVSSTSWNVSTNWNPNGVPSTNDSVTIVTGSNTVHLENDVTVKRFTITSGTLDLNGKTLTISTLATFTAGTINNGHLTASGSSTITFGGTTFGAVVSATGNTIYFNGSVFNDSLSITKNGNSNDNSKGGNTFKKYVTLTNAARGALVLADSFPDVFEKILKVSNTNEGTVYLAHRAENNRFNDDVFLYGKNIYSNYYGTAAYSGDIIINCPAGGVTFGYSTGSSTLADRKKIGLGDSAFSAGKLYLRNFTKLGTEPSQEVTLSGSAKLYLEPGSVFNSPVLFSAPSIYLDGSRFNAVATITNTGTTTVTSEGGSYFADSASIKNNSTSSNTFTLGNSAPDSFAVSAYLQNLKGTFNVNNAVFSGKAYVKNTESATSDDRFMIATTGNVLFKGNISIENSGSGICFGKTSGTSTLQSGKTLTFVSGLTGNVTMKYFTEQGSTAHTFTLPSATTKLTLGPGTAFGGNLTFYGQQISLNGTTFNGNAVLSRYGNIPDTSLGGNVFNGTTTIQDSSNTAHTTLLAYSNADDFNGDVTFVQKGSGAILKPCYNKNSTFAGNVTINATSAFQFGGNGGRMILDGTSNQTLTNSTSNSITVKKLQINKTNTSFTLNTPITVSDSLFLSKGRINTDSVNVMTIANGGKVSGGSDSSYIQGPMKKIGNSTFVFPLGSSTLAYAYHPLEITAPSSGTDSYTANYFPIGQTIGSVSDTSVDNLNACQYWKLTRDVGASKVKVKLTWNHEICKTISPADIRLVGWNGYLWKNLGNSSCSGDSVQGNAISYDSLTTISYVSLAFKKCIAIHKSISSLNARCKNGSDGFASIVIDLGTPGYSYSWSGGLGQNSEVNNLRVGKYFITCFDAKGCNLSDSLEITEPDSLKLIFNATKSTCLDSTGSIVVNSIGGTGTVNYYWTNIQDTAKSLKNLTAGVYDVIATDSNGCPAMASVNVGNNDGPGVNIITQTNPLCFGADNGSLEVEGADGKDPFVYKWSTSEFDTLPSLSNLGAGSYIVQVTNNSGCISFDTLVITSPEHIGITIQSTPTPCGSSSGELVANVNGGIRPYSYMWVRSTSVDSMETGLSACFDTLTVTDTNGCQMVAVSEVINSTGMTIEPIVLSNVDCFPYSLGSATVSISGGTSPGTWLVFSDRLKIDFIS